MKHPSSFIMLIMIALMLGTPACSHRSKISRKKITVFHTREPHEAFSIATHSTNPPLTIWIHGTKLLDNSHYKKIFNMQAHLKKVTDIPLSHDLRIVGDTLHANAPEAFPQQTFYIFGWSGKLRAQEREACAFLLDQEIKRVIQEYIVTYGTTPLIRMITHSHGGNIALNLAKINNNQKNSYQINELILLACPVQLTTKNFLKDNLFHKVHAFYSSVDFVQVIAPQMYYKSTTLKKGKVCSEIKIPLFSRRCFDDHEKLTQVNVRMNGRSIFHNEFIGPSFLKTLPHVLNEISEWKGEQISCTRNPKKRLVCIYTKRWKMGRNKCTT